MKKQAEEWLKYALTDLQSTRALLHDENLTRTAAFHAQQCIEKSLKAIFELYNKQVPRLHDLRKLIKKIEKDIGTIFEFDEELIDKINQVYIDSRYPSDFGLLPEGIPAVSTVKGFLNEAEKIFNQSKHIIERINT